MEGRWRSAVSRVCRGTKLEKEGKKERKEGRGQPSEGESRKERTEAA